MGEKSYQVLLSKPAWSIIVLGKTIREFGSWKNAKDAVRAGAIATGQRKGSAERNLLIEA